MQVFCIIQLRIWQDRHCTYKLSLVLFRLQEHINASRTCIHLLSKAWSDISKQPCGRREHYLIRDPLTTLTAVPGFSLGKYLFPNC